jgi:hypothetical protein
VGVAAIPIVGDLLLLFAFGLAQSVHLRRSIGSPQVVTGEIEEMKGIKLGRTVLAIADAQLMRWWLIHPVPAETSRPPKKWFRRKLRNLPAPKAISRQSHGKMELQHVNESHHDRRFCLVDGAHFVGLRTNQIAVLHV